MKSLILASVAVALLFGCSKSTEPQEQLFKVKTDSVQFQKTISLGDTVTLRFWGFVGSSGCYSLSNFESNQQPSKLDITVWGKYTPGQICTTVIIEMRGTKYSFVPTSKGSIQIVIHQPDGSALIDTLIVQ